MPPSNDGMDVINLSIGGTEIDPASDGLVRAVQGPSPRASSS